MILITGWFKLCNDHFHLYNDVDSLQPSGYLSVIDQRFISAWLSISYKMVFIHVLIVEFATCNGYKKTCLRISASFSCNRCHVNNFLLFQLISVIIAV